MKKKLNIKSACKQCGHFQKEDEKQSNDNWTVYNLNEKCTCGGEYVLIQEVDEIITIH